MSSIARIRKSSISNRPSGGGSKLSGLPLSIGGNSYAKNARRNRAYVPYDKRNITFCINQLGGVGKSRGMFMSSADGVKCKSSINSVNNVTNSNTHEKPSNTTDYANTPNTQYAMRYSTESTDEYSFNTIQNEMESYVDMLYAKSTPISTIGDISDFKDNYYKLVTFMTYIVKTNPFNNYSGSSVPWIDINNADFNYLCITQRQLAYCIILSICNYFDNGGVVGDNAFDCVLLSSEQFDGGCDNVISIVGFLVQCALEYDSFINDTSRNDDDDWNGTRIIVSRPSPQSYDDSFSTKINPDNMTLHPYYDTSGVQLYYTSDMTSCTLDGINDFMCGQNGQMLIDIAGGGVGGGGMCNIANTQDESLMIFYPEILLFTFFVSQAKNDGCGSSCNVKDGGGNCNFQITQLTTKNGIVFLGTRRYLNIISGEGSGTCGTIDQTNTLNADISRVSFQTITDPIDGNGVYYTSSFGAIASTALQSCCSTPLCTPACIGTDTGCTKAGATCIQNRYPGGVNTSDCIIPNINVFANFIDHSAYDSYLVNVLSSTAGRIGTGPWGAGAWMGNSQTFYLVLLAASSLTNIPIDYYIYDRFCENPGNQCYVLDFSNCSNCLSAYSDINLDEKYCGTKGVYDINTDYSFGTIQGMLDDITDICNNGVRLRTNTLFDQLLNNMSMT